MMRLSPCCGGSGKGNGKRSWIRRESPTIALHGNGRSGISLLLNMDKDAIYDVCITGGGLAGLASAILLGRSGYKVILYEKESYPFHKVCGEYISMESWNFLRNLGLPLPHWG